MSRSIRRPYMPVVGLCSAAYDKRTARRSVRHTQNHVLKFSEVLEDLEDLLLPHRLDCADNDVWGWGRDGNQMYIGHRGSSEDPHDLRLYQRVMRK